MTSYITVPGWKPNMKYIPVPETIELKTISGGPVLGEDRKPIELTFEDFVMGRLLDKRFATGVPMILIALKITEQVKAANGVLVLEDADYKELLAAVTAPSDNVMYDPRWTLCMVPFMTAICEAKGKKPESKLPESAAPPEDELAPTPAPSVSE